MIQVLVLFLIVVPCLMKDAKLSFYVLAFLLPFHVIIKGILDNAGGGELFSAWKELVTMILIVKVLSGKHIPVNKITSIYITILFAIIFVYFFVNPVQSSALPALRNYLFPVLLFIAASSYPASIEFFKKIFTLFMIASFLSFLGGILQQFFFNIPISQLKGSIDFIDENGYIQYSTVSFRIMGFERMSGFFTGPNDLGVYCALVILLAVGYLLCIKNNDSASRRLRFFVSGNLMLAIFCILLSFSRAGWAIAIISVASIFYSTKTRVKISWIFTAIVVFIVAITLVISLYPKASDILTNSFTGKEASAAERGNSFNRGLIMNLQEPYGHGVGTTDYRYKASFFVESAWLNTGYEIGLIGLIVLLLLLFNILSGIRSSRLLFNKNLYSHFAVSVLIASIIAGFVSINIFGTTYIYYWWLLMGLGINKSFQIYNSADTKKRSLAQYLSN